MKTYELVETLRNARKPVITTNDMAKFTGGKRKYASLAAQRLVRRGIFQALEKGKYTLRDTPIFAIASNVIFPSYISFLAGLALHELIDQIPSTVTVVTARSRRELQILQTTVRFVRLPSTKLFGYKKIEIDGWPVFVGEPEKIILDSLYLPEYCPHRYATEALRSKRMDRKKLNEWAKRYPRFVRERIKKLSEGEYDR